MKLSLKKAGISAAIAGGLLLVTPSMAQAITYAPENENTLVFEVTDDGPVSAGGFQANVDTTGQLAGRGINDGDLATANLPVTSTSITKKTDAQGNVTYVVNLPEDKSGTYTLAITGARADGSAGTGGTTPIGGGSGSTGGSSNSSNALPATGFDANSMLGLWVGGGALALAGGTIAVATTVRRNRKA